MTKFSNIFSPWSFSLKFTVQKNYDCKKLLDFPGIGFQYFRNEAQEISNNSIVRVTSEVEARVSYIGKF